MKILKSENKLFDEYSDICDEYMESLKNYTKLLGYPDVIQNSMEEECAAVTRGINMGRNRLSSS